MEAATARTLRQAPDLPVWAGVGAYAMLAVTTFSASRFMVPTSDAIAVATPLVVGSIASIAALTIFPGLRVARIISAILQFSLCGVSTAMLAFSAARLGMPLIDAQLLSFDHAIGYDWETFASIVARSPELELFLERSYEALFWQPFLAAVVLSFYRDAHALNKLVIAHLMVMMITVVIFAIWPAMTAWAYLQTPAPIIRQLHLQSTMNWVNGLVAIRSGVPLYVSAQSSFAIIGFPSYHCAAGFLYSYTFWSNQALRYPVVVVNVMMIAATPIMGGHYLADVVGAMLVTCTAIWLTRLAFSGRRDVQESMHWRRRPFVQA